MSRKSTVTVAGQLEIDVDRGVIYFHASDSAFAEKFQGVTVLRICGLPKPVPLDQGLLDVTCRPNHNDDNQLVSFNWM